MRRVVKKNFTYLKLNEDFSSKEATVFKVLVYRYLEKKNDKINQYFPKTLVLIIHIIM
ncbi:hypothetical protein C8C83_1775 [Flavobacterium sp. 90]|nr:hypothetical protein C8C82_2077 [Flavobacterium sp. 81]TCK53889.1 hypothetical protein C8C83_1775 [Flavobacterium sp. 90]